MRDLRTLRMTTRRSVVLLVALSTGLFAPACGDDAGTESGRITAEITSTSRSVAFAPAEIQFSADYEAADDVDPNNVRVSWDFGDGAGSSGSFAVTHTFEQAGTYTVAVTIREERGDGSVRGEGSAETVVQILPRADLRVTPLFLDERAVRSQDPLRATFDLFNDAAEIPLEFEAGIYLARPGLLNRANPPDTDALGDLELGGDVYLIATRVYPSFGGEGTQDTADIRDILVPCEVPSNEYEAFVFADHTGIVGEFDELNNVGFSPNNIDYINTCSEGPDLSVNEVHARPSRTNLLETLTVDIEIANFGTESASFFDYEVYLSFLNPDLDDGDLLVASGEVDTIVANGEVDLDRLEITLDEPQATLGTYFVIVDVDASNTVVEANESNNTGASSAITVTDEPIPGTDLIPTEFSFSPETSFLDGSLSLRASVLNQGDEDSPSSFFCRVYMSQDDELDTDVDRQLDSINFPPIAANSEVVEERVSLIPGFFDPGLYFMFLFCDPTFRVPEADEDNNILMADGRLEVSTDPEIDLRFETFELAPTTVDNETEVTLTMRVCNDGTNGAGPSLARVWLSADGLLSSSDTLFFEALIDSVDAGACVDFVEQITAVCDTFQPTYTVFASLDVSDLLPETNEANNDTTISPFTIEGTICQCEVDALESNARGSNNSPSTPTFVSARCYDDLSMCDLARDWYAIPLERGETVRAITTFEGRRGNLDMTLFAANRSTILDTSTSDGDREEVIAFVVSEDGDYLLKVYGRSDPENSTDANAYSLCVEISPPVSGIDLFVTNIELSNDRPVLAESVEVTFDVVNIGDLPAGENTARLYLSEDAEVDAATDILLGETVFGSVPGASGVRRRTVEVTMPGEGPGGPRYIGVVADAENSVPGELDETNNAGFSDLFELDAGCFDPLEPNNSLARARLVEITDPVTTLTGLSVCSENRDFYEICAQSGDFLRMTTLFDGETYDVDMRLYDSEGRIIDRAEGTTGEEVLEIDFIPASVCYFLEIMVIGPGREAPYDLVLESDDAPAELVCNTVAEPNDTFSDAARIGDVLEFDLAVCPVADIDFFSVNVASGTALEFRFEPVDGEDTVPADLRMNLYSPSRAFLTNSVSATEPLVFTTTATGRHFLRVSSVASGPRNQRFRLVVDGLDGRDLQPVDLTLDPGSVGADERVQYDVTIVNNRTLGSGLYSYAVFLSDDPVIDPDSDTLLEEVAMPSLAGATGVDVSGRFRVPAGTPGGLHFVGVWVDSQGQVDEFEEGNNLDLAPLDVLAACARDGAEPNDVRLDAVDMGDYTGAELTLCPGDTDWFTLATSSGDTVTIDATFNVVDGGGDLDLFVYDASLAPLAEGESIGDDETVTFAAPAGDFVYVEVAPFGLTNFPYTLAVTVE